MSALNILYFLIFFTSFLLVLPLFIISFSNEKYATRFNYSIGYFKSRLGYIISIAAKIRTGKTTLMSGLSHIFQIVTISVLQEKLEDIKMKFYYIDFNLFDYFVTVEFELNQYHIVKTTESLIDKFNLDRNKLYFNFLSHADVFSIIHDYVEAYYVLNYRNQYVYSKTTFYSHITNKTNLKFDLEWTKIRTAYKNQNYAIYNHSVELIDESTDDIGAGKQNEDIKDLTGAKEYLRKYGQIHKETNRRITTKQDSTDEVARFRRLTQSNINLINKVQVVGNFRTFNSLINRTKSFIIFLNKILFRILALIKGRIKKDDLNEFINEKLNSYYPGKYFISKLTFIQCFLFSQAYCQFDSKIYDDEAKVGKTTEDSFELVRFVIPLKYCFGCFNSHEYAYIQDELIKNSKLSYDDLDHSLLFKDKKTKYFNDNIAVESGGGLTYGID